MNKEENNNSYKPGLISKIDDDIYITDHIGAQDYTKLRELNIKRVISLGEESEHLYYQFSRTENPDEDIEYLDIVISDSIEEDISKHFLKTNVFITSSTTPVLIHCWAGISRSVTIAMAYYIKVKRMSYLGAFFKIQTIRPFVRPNSKFQEALFELENENNYA